MGAIMLYQITLKHVMKMLDNLDSLETNHAMEKFYNASSNARDNAAH